MWAAGNLVNSRTGRAIMAIRDNPIAAATMGVHTALYKTVTFGVSALVTALAGALSAIVLEFVAPDRFTFLLSVYFLIGLLLFFVGWLPRAVLVCAFFLSFPTLSPGLSPPP